MRFKEFFTEQDFPNKELQQGYSLFTIPGGNTIQIPTSIRQKYDDKAILDLLKKQGYPISSTPTPTATPGQGASMKSATPPSSEEPPTGYRFYTLPNGNVAAVPQQLDNKQALELIKRKRPDLITAAKPPANKPITKVVIPADLPPLPAVDPKLMATAKKSAETFLGRMLSPKEWDHLLRATFAESGHNAQEDAHIMGTILNRVRQGEFGGTNVSSVLASPNQFQSVSGVPGERTQSSNFVQGPPADHLTRILSSAAKILPKVPKDLVNFTAANEKAYGKGTNPEFLKRLKKAGGKLIGKTVFGKLG